MVIRNNVRRQRLLANLTQEALAQRLGVRRETIVHLENGHYTPSLEVAMMLAQEFDMPFDELFYFAEEPEPEPKEVTTIFGRKRVRNTGSSR